MKIIGPFMQLPSDSAAAMTDTATPPPDVVPNQQIAEYFPEYFRSYRAVIDTFFPRLRPFLATYANYPYHTRVLRMGDAGFIIGHTPDVEPRVSFMRPDEFDPPLARFNFFDIIDRWRASFASFNFSENQSYTAETAQVSGARQALSDALAAFWMALPVQGFENLCRNLIELEGFSETPVEVIVAGRKRDLMGEIVLHEPAGFRRIEQWGFEFKHYPQNRVSAHDLREVEDQLAANMETLDVLCLVTSGDITSVGKSIAVDHPKIRVWDRSVLERLINIHLPAIAPFFPEYEAATMHVAKNATTTRAPSLCPSFTNKLAQCARGHATSRDFEELGTQLFVELFTPNLASPKSQRTTSDRTLRRDVLFRNTRTAGFWTRIASRFEADMVVVDFKNYTDEIGPPEIDDTARYLNTAVGNFAIVFCRQGPSAAVEAVQLRWLREKKVILVVNDAQMIEMATRKDRGEKPEDLLDDLLDELLAKF